jgi:hypothetical protein
MPLSIKDPEALASSASRGNQIHLRTLQVPFT